MARRGFTAEDRDGTMCRTFLPTIWDTLNCLVKATFELEGDLKTIHFIQQQFSAGIYGPHADIDEGGNVTVVVLLYASVDLKKFHTGLCMLQDDKVRKDPVLFESSLDAVAFPGFCNHQSYLPTNIPKDDILLKAALFYDEKETSFHRLFPEEKFIPARPPHP